MFRLISLTITLNVTFLTSIAALAQNTGGVFPPMVNEGHRSLQYRVAANPDNAQDEFGFAQRIHYQQAINGDFMWRVVGQTRKTTNSDLDLDYLQTELFWELSDDDDTHKTGFRFDARVRNDNRSEQFGLNWMNQFNLEDGWRARAVFMSAVQTGDNSADGVNLQTRGQLAKSFDGYTLGFDMFNNYGNTGRIGSFKTQTHTIGPFIAAPVSDKFSIYAGPLFGISKAAPDLEARLWFTRGF